MGNKILSVGERQTATLCTWWSAKPQNTKHTEPWTRRALHAEPCPLTPRTTHWITCTVTALEHDRSTKH